MRAIPRSTVRPTRENALSLKLEVPETTSVQRPSTTRGSIVGRCDLSQITGAGGGVAQPAIAAAASNGTRDGRWMARMDFGDMAEKADSSTRRPRGAATRAILPETRDATGIR